MHRFQSEDTRLIVMEISKVHQIVEWSIQHTANNREHIRKIMLRDNRRNSMFTRLLWLIVGAVTMAIARAYIK